jgi:hypothetical protein
MIPGTHLKIATAVLATTVLAGIGAAQDSWERVYGKSGSEAAVAILPTQDHNYFLIIGTQYALSPSDANSAYVIKVNSSGDTIWTKSINVSGGIEVKSVTATLSGDYLIAGEAISADESNFNISLIMIKSNGDVIWTKTYGGDGSDYVDCITSTQDGNFLVAGATEYFSPDHFSAGYLMKIKPNGDTVWKKDCGESVSAVTLTKDGNYLIQGSITVHPNVGATYGNILIRKINSDGDVIWVKNCARENDDYPIGIMTSPDGMFLAAGFTRSPFSSGDYNIRLLKMKPNGETVWEYNYGGAADDFARAIAMSFDGSCWVAGESVSSGNVTLKIHKIAQSGDLILTKTFTGTVRDNIKSILATPDGNCLITGRTCLSDSSGDVYLRSLVDFRRAYKGLPFTYKIASSGDTLDYGFVLLKAPEGMTVSPGGTISWTPSSGDSTYSVPVTYLIVKDNGQKDTGTFSVWVNSTGSPVKAPNGPPAAPRQYFSDNFSIQRVASNGVRFSFSPDVLSLSIFTMDGRLLERIHTQGNSCAWGAAAGGRYVALAKGKKRTYSKPFMPLK